MAEGSICFENSPVVVSVARIVSPAIVSLFWMVKIGAAEAREIKNIDRKIIEHLI